MRDLLELDQYRLKSQRVMELYGGTGDSKTGAFFIPIGTEIDGYRAKTDLQVIAAVADGWDHVSVSTEYRTPTWEEMMLVHRLFFKENEHSMQFQVSKKLHINNHPYCLHLWRERNRNPKLPTRDLI